jgi:hypothetical protein
MRTLSVVLLSRRYCVQSSVCGWRKGRREGGREGWCPRGWWVWFEGGGREGGGDGYEQVFRIALGPFYFFFFLGNSDSKGQQQQQQ